MNISMFVLLNVLCVAWGAKTHRNILAQSLVVLTKDKRPSADFFNVENAKFIEKLRLGSTDPDKVETGSGMHYYVYPGKGTKNTGQYYKHAGFNWDSGSARTRMEAHYKNATRLYKSGDKENAFHMLGRALHYLMDIGCPPHAAGIKYPMLSFMTNHHKLFETYANNVTGTNNKQYHITTAESYYGKTHKDVLGYEVNELCAFSAGYASNVKSSDERKYDVAIIATTKESEGYTCAMMDQFYNDVKL